MKTITFIRHAKSDWSHPDLRDINRPLNKRGMRNALQMGERLKKMNYKPEAIFISPSVRTIQTMDLISRRADWDDIEVQTEEWIYEANVSNYLNFIDKLDDSINSIAFCGHNPTITEIVTYLSGQYISNVPTCGVAIIKIDFDEWKMISGNIGELTHYDYPKNLNPA